MEKTMKLVEDMRGICLIIFRIVLNCYLFLFSSIAFIISSLLAVFYSIEKGVTDITIFIWLFNIWDLFLKFMLLLAIIWALLTIIQWSIQWLFPKLQRARKERRKKRFDEITKELAKEIAKEIKKK